MNKLYSRLSGNTYEVQSVTFAICFNFICCFQVTLPAGAQDLAGSTTIEGGRGLLYTQSARTNGKGVLTVGLKGFGQLKEYYIPGSSGTALVKSEDVSALIAAPLTFGLTDEVDITASFYGFANARPLLNQDNVTAGWGSLKNGQGVARLGLKVRLPFSEGLPVQIAGSFGALLDTASDHLNGFNSRWTTPGTDIEASMLETLDITSYLSLYLQQGYVLSGVEYYDDQLVGAAGMQLRFRNRAALNIEAVNRTYRGIGLVSAMNAGNDISRYSTPGGVGSVRYLIDTDTDYMEDFFILAPSVTFRINDHFTIDAGALINVADHRTPVETVQGVFGLTFRGGFSSMYDSDHDGVNNRIDREPSTPLGYPVDRYGIAMDSDRDGVPDGIDREADTPLGALVSAFGIAQDNDGDGVFDGLDMEPNTLRGISVDSRGIALDSDRDGIPDGLDREMNSPYGAIVDASGIAIDSDNDGIPDGIDLEPDTIHGASIGQQGRALDTDGDGVPDGIDQEPDTPRGIVVDAAGRAVVREEYDLLQEGILRLNSVRFTPGSAILTTDSYSVLDDVGELLKKYPTMKVQIGGHTDSSGDKASNYRLSRERALAVRDYLLINFPQITSDRLQAVGYGSDKPVTTNATLEGRDQNRRVEFIVINRDEFKTMNRNQ
jgi:outer membrane protein OmpA-like peptidoglycan-associated protein